VRGRRQVGHRAGEGPGQAVGDQECQQQEREPESGQDQPGPGDAGPQLVGGHEDLDHRGAVGPPHGLHETGAVVGLPDRGGDGGLVVGQGAGRAQPHAVGPAHGDAAAIGRAGGRVRRHVGPLIEADRWDEHLHLRLGDVERPRLRDAADQGGRR
jgi:hypothetical protein